MKRLAALILAIFCITIFSGCKEAEKSGKPDIKDLSIVETYNSDIATYYKMSDGSWQANGQSYEYRLEISGRMPNAAVDSTFVYLSNIENITFEQAWKAAGFSSNTADYFSADEAVLVEIQNE